MEVSLKGGSHCLPKLAFKPHTCFRGFVYPLYTANIGREILIQKAHERSSSGYIGRENMDVEEGKAVAV